MLEEKIISQILDPNRGISSILESRNSDNVSQNSEVGSFSKISGTFQTGGVPERDGRYLVGENGPEIVKLPKGSAVIPLNISDLIEGLKKFPELSDFIKGEDLELFADPENPSVLLNNRGKISLGELEKKYEDLSKNTEPSGITNKEISNQIKEQRDLLKDLKSAGQKKIEDSIKTIEVERDKILKSYGDVDLENYKNLVSKLIEAIPKNYLNPLTSAKMDLIAAKSISVKKDLATKDMEESVISGKVKKMEGDLNLSDNSKNKVDNRIQITNDDIKSIANTQEKFIIRELEDLNRKDPEVYRKITEMLKMDSETPVNQKSNTEYNKFKEILSGKTSAEEVIKRIEELPLGSLINKDPESIKGISELIPQGIVEMFTSDKNMRKIPELNSDLVKKEGILKREDVIKIVNNIIQDSSDRLIKMNNESESKKNKVKLDKKFPGVEDQETSKQEEKFSSALKVANSLIKSTKKDSEFGIKTGQEDFLENVQKYSAKNLEGQIIKSPSEILGSFKTGGLATSSGNYLVGENGPELIKNILDSTSLPMLENPLGDSKVSRSLPSLSTAQRNLLSIMDNKILSNTPDPLTGSEPPETALQNASSLSNLSQIYPSIPILKSEEIVASPAELKNTITPLTEGRKEKVPSINESIDKLKDGLVDVFKKREDTNMVSKVKAESENPQQPVESKPASMESSSQPGESGKNESPKDLQNDLADIKTLLSRISSLLEGPLEVSTIESPFRPDSRKV